MPAVAGVVNCRTAAYAAGWYIPYPRTTRRIPPIATRWVAEKRPAAGSPAAGAAARTTRPARRRTKAARSANRTPRRSAIPPKKNIESVMPHVSVPTMTPAARSDSPTYWLKYMAR